MQPRDVLEHSPAPTTSATERPSRSVATAEPAQVPLEEELRRFLGEARGAQPCTFELSWKGLSSPESAEAGAVEVPASLDEPSELLKFLEPLAPDAEQAPASTTDARAFPRRSQEVTESHAPELSGGRPSTRVFSDTGRGTGPDTALARVSAVERAMASFKAEAADLTVRLQAAEQSIAAQAQRVHDLELERSTALKTAEYLESQRASLAEELQQAWAAHERDEQTRITLQAAVSEAQSSRASGFAAATEETHRVDRRLRELETAHTEALALNAALRIELERLAARYDDACTIAEADRASLDARTKALDEATAGSAQARDTLKGVLADLEDLSSWARTKSARLAETIRHHDGRATES